MAILLSICIPCYGRVEYVRKTLQSIYQDNSDVSLSDYEVVISDNDPDCAIKILADEFNHYTNFKYFHTECEGFMNSYYALTYGNGDLLVLHNGQTRLKKGTLSLMVNDAKAYITDKPLIFYTNGFLGKLRKSYFDNFDSYMFHLSYWSSWSDGFTIWKSNFDVIGNITLNKLFPQTSLFLTQSKSKQFIIDDRSLFDGQRILKRGGHNKFKAFTIEYPSLIDQCFQAKEISHKCKEHIFWNILSDFLPQLYFNKYIARSETFEATGFKNNLKMYFPKYSYYLVIVLSLFQPLKILKRRIFRSFTK